jgi:RNA polymerase sigma-70 factor (ECF subfamily)
MPHRTYGEANTMKTFLSHFSLLLLVVMTAGCDSPSVGAEPKAVGKEHRSTRLYIRTVPPGASIKINGKSAGKSDRLLEFQAPAGAKKVVIEVELDDRIDRKEIIIRGGEINRVEFDLSGSGRESGTHEAAASSSESRELGERLKQLHPALRNLVDLPRGWRAVRPVYIVPRRNLPLVEQRLGGGKIAELYNSEFQTPHGAARINVICGPTDADADKIHRGVLSMKGDPAYCVRLDRVIVELAGTFDVPAAKRIFGDLGLDASKTAVPPAAGQTGALPGLVRGMQPVVVRTTPASGDTQVDPATTEIRVTYSKDMQDGSWSWSQISDESFPETTGSPRYLDDKRTCALPVKLQPGKTYVIWLNSNRFTNFKDADGQSAVPYLLVFETKK